MAKTNTGITLDDDVKNLALSRGVNISGFCNTALREYLCSEKLNVQDLDKRLEELHTEEISIKAQRENLIAKMQTTNTCEQQLHIFLYDLGPKIVNSFTDMEKWARRTGKTVEELKELKLKHNSGETLG